LINTGGVNNPTIGFDLDTGNDGLDNPNGRAGWTILDSIGIYGEADEPANGRLYAPINFGPGATPVSSLPAGATYVQTTFELGYPARWANSTGQTAADWLVSNLTDSPDSSFTGHGDFRQSANPHAANGALENNQGVPWDTIITGTLGSANIGPS